MEEYAKAEESSRKARVSFISHQVLYIWAILVVWKLNGIYVYTAYKY